MGKKKPKEESPFENVKGKPKFTRFYWAVLWGKVRSNVTMYILRYLRTNVTLSD